MNLKSKIIISSVLLMSGFGVSCSHDFEEINTDPNKMNVGDLEPYGMFESLLYNTASQQNYLTWYWNDELVQFTACTSVTGQERHRYLVTDKNCQDIWSNYAVKAGNAVHMYKLATKFNIPSCQAIALTMKVYLLSNLTDIFGDIPYSEAFMGDEGLDKPKFDSQKEVYEQMFADLEEANRIYAQNPTFDSEKTKSDIMYGGDLKLWRKFNNSLYLRLLTRVSGRAEMNAGDKIREILNDTKNYPVISANTESATIHNTGVDPYYNFFRPSKYNEDKFTKAAYRITEQFLKMTVRVEGTRTIQDPRITTWAKQYNSENGWKGTIAGCSIEDQRVINDGTSLLNYEVLVRDAAPSFLLDYSEVLFIKAEAAHKNWIDGGDAKAREYYENAVRASCQKWAEFETFSKTKAPINDANIDKLLSSSLANWDSYNDKAQLIAEQKWLSLFWVGMEAFHEIRRTGWPLLTIGAATTPNNHHFPQRLFYPSITVGPNPDNVAAALRNMGGENNMRTPVWWSIEAITGTFPIANPEIEK